jgi:hypothetical protein
MLPYPNLCYDELGRVVNRSINGAANTGTANFDPMGRVTSMTNQLSSGTFTYLFSSTQVVFSSDRASYWESYWIARCTCGRNGSSRSMDLMKGTSI